MPLPISPKYAGILSGVVGIPTASIVGWQLSGRGGPSAEPNSAAAPVPSSGTGAGVAKSSYPARPYVYRSTTLDSLLQSVVSQTENPKQVNLLQRQTCFNNLFPQTYIALPGSDVEGTSPSTQPPDIYPNDVSGNHPLGCTFMQLSHSSDGGKFIFVSETAVRRGKVGLAVWAVGSNVKFKNNKKPLTDDESPFLRYYVFGLEQTGGGFFYAKFGFTWLDRTFNEGSGASLSIKSPDQQLTGEYSKSSTDEEVSDLNGWEHKNYLGIWASGETGTSEIFEQVKVESRRDGSSAYAAEILGKKWSDLTPKPESGDPVFGYNQMEKYADLSKSYSSGVTWIKYESSQRPDKHLILRQWYSLFKDKKGDWTKCSGTSLNKDSFAVDIENFKNVCGSSGG